MSRNEKTRIVVYDANPGKGVAQWWLWLSWAVWANLLWFFGFVDYVHTTNDWREIRSLLFKWRDTPIEVQFWCHGSPGLLWWGGYKVTPKDLDSLTSIVSNPRSLVWFRACSVFRGELGHAFARMMAEKWLCTIAAHTRIIGFFQGGLHTHSRFMKDIGWSIEEGELGSGFLARNGLLWGSNTILCMSSSFPKEW